MWFVNSRDKLTIQAGAVIRANPTRYPSFTPYLVRLHRFFVPMQLYHPEMRLNAAKFDIRNLSANLLSLYTATPQTNLPQYDFNYFKPTSCLAMLRLASGYLTPNGDTYPSWMNVNSPGFFDPTFFDSASDRAINADPLIGYWDIIRNYYAFSQTGQFSLAFDSHYTGFDQISTTYQVSTATKWKQYFGDLTRLDDFFETSFYQKPSTSRFYDRSSLFATLWGAIRNVNLSHANLYNQNYTFGDVQGRLFRFFMLNSPLAVAPASPDRLSRALSPANDNQNVAMTGISNIRDLAVAARLQEYLDLLGAGGSRFSDWLQTFFAAKISHVDRPTLLHSSSFYLNSNPLYNSAGTPGAGLGEFGGVVSGEDNFGRRPQTYTFDEPGYVFDLISVVPQYFWAGVIEDYAYYDGSDYFNPIFNQTGFQTFASNKFISWPSNRSSEMLSAIAREPVFNEFRSSYDEVLGDMAFIGAPAVASRPTQNEATLWVQQRGYTQPANANAFARFRFVDLSQVNTIYTDSQEDNMFINLYYNVKRVSLVSKFFATKLATR